MNCNARPPDPQTAIRGWVAGFFFVSHYRVFYPSPGKGPGRVQPRTGYVAGFRAYPPFQVGSSTPYRAGYSGPVAPLAAGGWRLRRLRRANQKAPPGILGHQGRPQLRRPGARRRGDPAARETAYPDRRRNGGQYPPFRPCRQYPCVKFCPRQWPCGGHQHRPLCALLRAGG